MIGHISLIIVTWNGDSLLEQCLQSLQKIYPQLPATFVVDNAMSTSTKKLCDRFIGIKYLSAPHNIGFAGGNNMAFSQCNTEYILLLNNDTQFISDSITPLYEFIRNNPKIGAVQGRALLGSDKNKLDGCGLKLTPLGQLLFPGYLRPADDPAFSIPRKLFASGGAFLMLRRSAIKSIGDCLFHDFFFAYYEDVDLCTRLGLCGYESWYYPTPPIIHHKSITAKTFGIERSRRLLYINQWSSLLICFNAYGILRLGSCLFAINLILPAIHANFRELIFQTKVILSLLGNILTILSERKKFHKYRSRSDHEYINDITHLC